MKLKYILFLLLLLPVLSACDQTDDVIEIFAGKTWKLTAIYYEKGSNNWCMDYWNNQNEKDASDNLFKKDGNFTIQFAGIANGDEGLGEFSGYAANSPIEGKWVANGKNNSFKITGQANPGSGEDILGKAFINGLINADKYKGNVNSLSIYFEDKDKKDRRLLLFRVVN